MSVAAPRGARLSHTLRAHRDGAVVLTVQPGDGRYTERYRVPRSEMRRFAWAVLADLDPEEAAEAALEEGSDLSMLCAGAPTATPLYRPPPPGSKKWRILQLLQEGAHTREAISARIPEAARADALLHELKVTGFVAHAEPVVGGRKALWALTERGRALEQGAV